ncbi:MAG: SprT-like domain-containing protein [Cyanobacteria bacterium P01_F01_bin.53]
MAPSTRLQPIDRKTPTGQNYQAFNTAYEHFNTSLFGGQLPPCLITFQRTNRAYGYFAPQRFGSREGENVIDEIALNPNHFKSRTVVDVLSTLVHEMVHLWHEHFGLKPPRRCYHNKEWAAKMKSVGLIPSRTGKPGGKETGQRVTHYIEEGGVFDVAVNVLLKEGFTLPYVDLWTEKTKAIRKKKAASKTKYCCPRCGLNAWAKPEVKLACGECMELMLPQE